MDKERRNRYRDKINLIDKRLLQTEEWLSYKDEKTKLACYKAFQEAMEGMTDIIAMVLSDKDKSVKDDYSNIEQSKEIFDLIDEEIDILKESNGLRNRIIHKYNSIDDGIIKESLEKILPVLMNVLDKFEKNGK